MRTLTLTVLILQKHITPADAQEIYNFNPTQASFNYIKHLPDSAIKPTFDFAAMFEAQWKYLIFFIIITFLLFYMLQRLSEIQHSILM